MSSKKSRIDYPPYFIVTLVLHHAIKIPMFLRRALQRRGVSFCVRSGDGEEWRLESREGARLHKVLQEEGVPIVGSCSGNRSCSTCHIILSENLFKGLPVAEEDELDMLDMAAAVTDTSRLACALNVSSAMEGETLDLPNEVTDYW